jgi:hypothetical protein
LKRGVALQIEAVGKGQLGSIGFNKNAVEMVDFDEAIDRPCSSTALAECYKVAGLRRPQRARAR